MLNLTSRNTEFASEYLKSRLELQPGKFSDAITWFVSMAHLYKSYTKAAYAAAKAPIKYDDLKQLIQFCYPQARFQKLRGYEILSGVRFYEDKIGSLLRYGI